MRRPVVLVCNVLYFRNEITPVNAFGICLAFGGVLLYTNAKSTAAPDKSGAKKKS